jgi:hypothetical protein
MRKRDIKAAKVEADRLRWAERAKKDPPTRHKTVLRKRVPEESDSKELREIQATRNTKSLAPVAWRPLHHDVVGTEVWKGRRTVIGVHEDAVEPMLRWLAPSLLRVTGATPTGRKSDANFPRRGASIIVSLVEGTSGAHRDASDTLLLNVSGQRVVWLAPPLEVKVTASMLNGGDGNGPIFLPNECDPTRTSLPVCPRTLALALALAL